MQFCRHKIIYQDLSAYPRVICIQVPNLTVSVASLWFQAGSRYSPPEKEGLAHLFEHLFILRTKQYPRKQDWLVETEQKGLVYNAFTGRELVNYRLTSVPGNEQHTLNHLIKTYESAIITAMALKQEKSVVRNEEKRSRANPSIYIWRLADQGLWPNSELSKDVFGSEKSIQRITLEDIKNFRKEFYQPNNMTVVVITPRVLNAKIIRREVDHYTPQEERVFPRIRFLPVKKRVFEHRKIEDTIISVSYRLMSLSFKERVIMNFIANYLASSWVSVLIQRLRLERGLTYWVRSERCNLHDTGYLRFNYTAKRNQVDKTIEVVKKEMTKLRSQKLSKTALAIHKKAILTRILLGINNPYRILNYYAQFVQQAEKKIHLFNEKIQIIKQLTEKEILKIADEHLDDEQISVAMVGRNSEG